jgi:hypothetical protein
MANFNLIPTNRFDEQLKKGVLREGSKKLISRIVFNIGKVSQEVGNFLVSVFNETPVVAALKGQTSDDLPAHFGLTDSQAIGLVEGMAQVIRESIQIESKIVDGKAVVSIRAVQADFAQFLALPGASYISKPSNILIPVIEWMLIDPNIDIGQAAYDIVFSGDLGNTFDAVIHKVSRSGRAIMVELEKLGGGGGGYVLPEIVRGGLGENFIEFAIRQPGVARKAIEIVMGSVS